eukprot:m51a1_g11782 hypothetical protein (337) ;mRNA; r:293085-294516
MGAEHSTDASIERKDEHPEPAVLDLKTAFEYTLSPDSTVAVSSPLLEAVRRHAVAGHELTQQSILHGPDPSVVSKLLGQTAWESPSEERAVGCMLGMVLGDSIGHHHEFMILRYDSTALSDMPVARGGRFSLAPGQWTDDASMGLCIADSLIVKKGQWDPHDCMHRFLGWWYAGYNNAFRFDEPEKRTSVGLGGNISLSFKSYITDGAPYTCAGDKKDCPDAQLYRDWRWKTEEQYHYSPFRAESQPTYIGSYAMDAMAMALNVLWRYDSFKDAILCVANLRGDSDSVGAVLGQMAGAFWGASAIPSHWIEAVQRWDNGGEIATRASMLYHQNFDL